MWDKLSSKVRRLREMRSEEVLYRLREKCRVEWDRARLRRGYVRQWNGEFQRMTSRSGSSVRAYLEGCAVQRFYPSVSVSRRESVLAFMSGHFPSWIEASTEKADRLRNHYVSLLAHADVYLDAEINWHRDPVNRYEWPKEYWADYDLIGSRVCDPKIIHELNRHQHLPRLAKAGFLIGNDKFAEEAIQQMQSWIDQNPDGIGVNWQSSLEIALRSVSWMWTIFFLLPSPRFDEETSRRILSSLFQQLDHVYRYPSVYSSPNTHLLGESTALFMAGLLFPDLPRAAHWRKFGATMLVRSMNDQVSSEGVYREASTYYHCYAADFFLQAMVLARVNRFQFPEWMWNRLKQMFEFVAHITRSDGSIPLLGDDDGGRVLALSREDYSSFCDGLSSGAVLFGKADLKGAARAFNEETMWLLGEDAFDVFDSMDVQYHSPQHHFYAESGLCIQRSGYGVDANHLTFDCGDLGMLTGGHGHADALSLTMFGGGKEWLVDSGTAVYNSAPDWRGYFRSTRAHNTVVVDGLDQSEQGGTFSWRRKAHSRLIVSRSMPGIDYIEAEHNGYERLPDGVTHRRRVLFVKPDYWIVLDQLTGSGAHTFDFLYHFVPGAELFVFGEEQLGNADCRVRSGRSTMNLFFYASGPIQTHVDCSQYGPVQGWTSKRYGERQASPVLTATLKSFTPAVAMTVLSAAGDSPLSQRIATRTANSLAVAFRDRDYEDRCVFSPDSREIVLSNCRMRGEVFWMRSQQGVLKQLVGINAASFTVNGEVLFESDKPIPYVVVHLWENGMVIERGEHEGKVYVRDFRDRQFQRN